MFKSSHSPNMHQMMLQVLLASLPGIFALFYFFGWGVFINIAIASITAIATEAMILKIRQRDWRQALLDNSALVTAFLLAIALPPLVPWWISVTGVFFAIAFAKHLYGGLGYNPFNPAMVGYVLLIISFPVQMTSWSPASQLWGNSLSFIDTIALIFTGLTQSGISLELLINGFDGYSTATPLGTLKIALTEGYMTSEILTRPLFSWLAGVGWQWVNISFLLGGLY
ncbi:MAG: RnfABCDGE type electron transport complex subunit D, partial [Gammaproteobacteria bacterium]|nr:RnfABCDGE type electron transport complex subunit D [Gammaproteobacteria bacterium]